MAHSVYVFPSKLDVNGYQKVGINTLLILGESGAHGGCLCGTCANTAVNAHLPLWIDYRLHIFWQHSSKSCCRLQKKLNIWSTS